MRKGENATINSCEENELLDYYSSQQIEEYPDQLNEIAAIEDIKLWVNGQWTEESDKHGTHRSSNFKFSWKGWNTVAA